VSMLSTVNRWVQEARKLLTGERHLPLIDDCKVEMADELVQAWFHDGDLRTAIENVLARDPDDLAVRFVALSAYYRLANLSVIEEEGEIESRRQEFRDYLGYLVRLRDPDRCTAPADIRWEIVNACAVDDYSRALSLCDPLKEILPEPVAQYHCGRLQFLVALLPTLDTEQELQHWDLPLGKRPDGLRGIWQCINVGILYSASIERFPTRASLTDDGKDHLRDAIKHLERCVRTPEVPPSAHFMLARSYAGIGDGYNAARHYQWMIDHRQPLFDACATEAPLGETDWESTLLPGVHRCLVNAYDSAGELDKAITANTAWVEAFPGEPGTYERMARLFQSKGDYLTAYNWLRQEAERSPLLGEDPNVSIALALGSVAAGANIDATLGNFATAHPDQHSLIDALLIEYWPAYQRLAPESRERWATGALLRSTTIPHSPGLAAHSFAWVVERELRTTIFDKFRTAVMSRPFKNAEEDDKLLQGYVQGYGRISLGQMINLIERGTQARTPLVRELGDWLKREHPWLRAGLSRIRTDSITALRNREDHADRQTVKADELKTMEGACREILNILHGGTGLN
jgi:hypothetical protein